MNLHPPSSPPRSLPASRSRSRRARRASLPARGLRVALVLAVLPSSAWAIAFSPFDPAGIGGTVNGQDLRFGDDGSVYELDAWVQTGGEAARSLADLAADPLAGLRFDFAASLSGDGSDLLLSYEILNTGASIVSGLGFLSFVDAEIAEPTTSFFNEFATVTGAPATGQGFEIDEPGYAFGDIHDNLRAGLLDGTNAVGAGAPDDVSMAVSFALGDLAPGDLARIVISLSEDGDIVGPLGLVQQDPRATGTRLSYSGRSEIVRSGSPIPEPRSALLFLVGGAVLAARVRGTSR